LQKDYAVATALLSRDRASLLLERNFLGQSALHLAIQNPEMVKCLIENGFSDSIDAGDRNGTTPAMYAAAYNQADSVLLLIAAGAKPFPFDQLHRFCLLDYAMIRNSYDVIQKLIDLCLGAEKIESGQKIAGFCLWRYMLVFVFRVADSQRKGIPFLLRAGGKQITSKKGNTLLHLCTNLSEAKALLGYEGYPINQQNSRGYTPLMVLSRFGNPWLIQRSVSQGALVDTTDNNNMNALHHTIAKICSDPTWGSNTETWRGYMDTIAVLLVSNADALQVDSCRCACSVSGCTPTSRLLRTYQSHFGNAISLSNIAWLLEWYLLLNHLTSPEVLRQALTAMFRLQKFDELSMTHTCCAKHKDKLGFEKQHFYSPQKDEIRSTDDDLSAEIFDSRNHGRGRRAYRATKHCV
jgi:ankyrin repeat protein